MQVDPIKLTLKAAGTKHFKLKCDEPLSNFAFNFSLRRYILAHTPRFRSATLMFQREFAMRQGLTLVHFSAPLEPCLTHKNTLNTPTHPLTPP